MEKGYIEIIKDIWKDITEQSVSDVIIKYKLGNFIKTNKIGKKLTYFDLLTEILNKNYKSNNKYIMIFNLENKIDISIVNEHQKNIIEEFMAPLAQKDIIDNLLLKHNEEESEYNNNEVSDTIKTFLALQSNDYIVDKNGLFHKLLFDASDKSSFYLMDKDIRFDNSIEAIEFFNKNIKTFITNYDLFYNILLTVCDYDNAAESNNFNKYE